MECFRDGIDTNTHKARLAFHSGHGIFSSCCENLSGFKELTGTGYIHTCSCMCTHTHTQSCIHTVHKTKSWSMRFMICYIWWR